ncbi:MAG: hypothetical protein KJ587_09975 [Alphaproteobacteria bacterium]|nr:hypothetical protein [Alphaproteobacteria bacterium]
MSEAEVICSSRIAGRHAGKGCCLKYACTIAAFALLATHASAAGLPSYTEPVKPHAYECEPDTPAYQAIRGCSNLLGSPDTDPQMRIRIYTMRGYAWLKEEEPLAAVSDFSRAIQLDASNASAIKGRARAFEILKQYGDAIEDWTRLIAAKPSEPENYRERAYAYHLNGNYKLAVADFTAVLKLDEKNIDSWIGRANAYDALDKLPDALADFDSAIKLDATYPAVFTARAEMWDRRGENLKAIADYQESLKLNSINLKVRQALQRLGISHPYP